MDVGKPFQVALDRIIRAGSFHDDPFSCRDRDRRRNGPQLSDIDGVRISDTRCHIRDDPAIGIDPAARDERQSAQRQRIRAEGSAVAHADAAFAFIVPGQIEVILQGQRDTGTLLRQFKIVIARQEIDRISGRDPCLCSIAAIRPERPARLSGFIDSLQLSHIHSVRVIRTGCEMRDLTGHLRGGPAIFIRSGRFPQRDGTLCRFPGRRSIPGAGSGPIALPARCHVRLGSSAQSHAAHSRDRSTVPESRAEKGAGFAEAAQSGGSGLGGGTVHAYSARMRRAAAGHGTDTCAVFTGCRLVAESGAADGCHLRVPADGKRIILDRSCLGSDGDGIGSPGAIGGSGRADRNRIEARGIGARTDGKGPFPVRMGIIAECGSAHRPIRMGASPDSDRIGPHSAVIQIIALCIAAVRLDTEIMDGISIPGRRSVWPVSASFLQPVQEVCHFASHGYCT